MPWLREVSVAPNPLSPDVRQTRAASMEVDIRPVLPGTVPVYRMPGLGEPSVG